MLEGKLSWETSKAASKGSDGNRRTQIAHDKRVLCKLLNAAKFPTQTPLKICLKFVSKKHQTSNS